jgi:hypothetical protein
VVSVEATVTYTLTDDRRISLPCTSTLRLSSGRAADYRVFIDTTPVFAPATPAAQDTANHQSRHQCSNTTTLCGGGRNKTAGAATLLIAAARGVCWR